MWKIGEFSEMTNLTVKTLRYYNEIGLLIPENVDIYSGYRYYGEKNLQEIKIIDELKSVGFTLEETKQNWNNFNEDIMLKKKKELYQKQNSLNESIKKIDVLRSMMCNGSLFGTNEEKTINTKGGKYGRKYN